MLNITRQLISLFFRPFIYQKHLHYGVSALVCCKDEEYNIELCLKSLKGLVDQIICVDHNSSDKTHEKMIEFKNHNKNIKIVIEKFDGTSLKDARNLGLKHVEYNWLFNCGGDFILNSDDHKVKDFFTNLKFRKTLDAYQLSFVNLYGDLHHTYKNSNTIATGEYYIVSMTRNIKFVESGKFDYLKFPFFYRKKKISSPFFFHLSGMKSDHRLLYRNCYFEWREIVNFLNSKNKLNSPYLDYDYFEKYWQKALYETTAKKSLKYRHSRQMCDISIKRYSPSSAIKYPKIIQEKIIEGQERFKVEYKNNKPYLRRDYKDKEMVKYVPTQEDLDWNIKNFERLIFSKSYLQEIINEYE